MYSTRTTSMYSTRTTSKCRPELSCAYSFPILSHSIKNGSRHRTSRRIFDVQRMSSIHFENAFCAKAGVLITALLYVKEMSSTHNDNVFFRS